MQQRPLNITALSVASVALGLYAMVAGIALLLGGSIGTFAGSDTGIGIMVLGSIMFGVGMTSFFVGYGFWMEHRWSWVGGLLVAGVTVVSMLAMGLIGASYTSLALPIILGLSMIWYLLRPQIRERLVPTDAVSDAEADDGAGTEPARTSGVATEPGI